MDKKYCTKKLVENLRSTMNYCGVDNPTIYDIAEWFRDDYDIDIEIKRSKNYAKSYYYNIISNELEYKQHELDNVSYDDALNSAINMIVFALNQDYLTINTNTIN